MELHGENSFKVKAVANAAFKLDKLPFKIADRTEQDLSGEQGIGKSVASKVWELLHTGCIQELEALLAHTPPGILAMLTIKGLGPKKILIIWKVLEIETLGELYYACNENRLIEAKGFGLKTQEEIKTAIEFNMASQGLFLYAQTEKIIAAIFNELQKFLPNERFLFLTGDFRRKLEILTAVEIITTATAAELLAYIEKNSTLIKYDCEEGKVQAVHETGLPIRFILSDAKDFFKNLLITTGSTAHIEQIQTKHGSTIPSGESEEAIYRSLGLDFIEPELREGMDELQMAAEHRLPNLVTYEDIKGTLHNHSTYSDGVHSLKEMALYCKNELHLQYLGICDHSRTAVYANGLKEDRLQQQWEEIETLNQALHPFRIFKGIESDILGNGSLDYSDGILKQFDFVVASIHANLKMDEERATQRLIKAIENPFTTILGHPTGRLLLSRKGYSIDYKKVIDACAANQVAIEINSNPLRLDLDWRWHRYALEKGVYLSINPDAHRVEGFHDMYYGTLVARKGGVEASHCLNCFELEKLDRYFQSKKSNIK